MDRENVHELVDQLTPCQLDAVGRLLEVMIEPIDDDAEDDEPVSEEEERAVAESKEWFKTNKGYTFEEVVADLGFTMEQVLGDKESA